MRIKLALAFVNKSAYFRNKFHVFCVLFLIGVFIAGGYNLSEASFCGRITLKWSGRLELEACEMWWTGGMKSSAAAQLTPLGRLSGGAETDKLSC